MKNSAIVFTGLLLLALAAQPALAQGKLTQDGELGLTVPFGPAYDYNRIKVTRVVDGDTLMLESGERVVLIGVDSPERRTSAQARIESRKLNRPLRMVRRDGRKAAKFLADLVEGQYVRLEFDEKRKDHYGQLLAYVFKFECDDCKLKTLPGYKFEKLDDGLYLFVNATVIASGYAVEVSDTPPNNKYSGLFQKLYKDAEENKLGLMGEDQE